MPCFRIPKVEHSPSSGPKCLEEKLVTPGRTVSRILFEAEVRPVAIIHPGQPSRIGSSALPGSRGTCPGADIQPRAAAWAGRSQPPQNPIWACTRWGLPSRSCYQAAGALLPHRFTLTCSSLAGQAGGLLSVALAVPCGPRRYLASCPVVFGLSSPPAP